MNAIAVFNGSSSTGSDVTGICTLHQCNENIQTLLHFKLHGLKPNSVHAVHVHECGDLSDGCESACAHYNPFNKLHGGSELYGNNRHVGDIGNLMTDEKGNVDIEFYDDLIELQGKYSVIGRSIVIHEKEDDLGLYRNEKSKRGIESGKTGNAGKRISCAVIGISNKDFHPK